MGVAKEELKRKIVYVVDSLVSEKLARCDARSSACVRYADEITSLCSSMRSEKCNVRWYIFVCKSEMNDDVAAGFRGMRCRLQ